MPDRPSIPFTKEQNAEEAERIIAEQTPELMAWLADQGLTIEDADHAAWGRLIQDWGDRGLKAWHDWARLNLVAKKVTGREKVAAKIAVRFANAQFKKSQSIVAPITKDTAPLDHLQPHVAWVVRHPEFRAARGEEHCCEACHRSFHDPVLAALKLKYEKENPAPNEAALSLFWECCTSPKLRAEIFKLAAQSPKVPVKDEAAEVVDKAEVKRVSALKRQLAEAHQRATMPPAGAST